MQTRIMVVGECIVDNMYSTGNIIILERPIKISKISVLYGNQDTSQDLKVNLGVGDKLVDYQYSHYPVMKRNKVLFSKSIGVGNHMVNIDVKEKFIGLFIDTSFGKNERPRDLLVSIEYTY